MNAKVSNWIWENRTWVFSGIGVLVLGLLWKSFVRLFRSWPKPPVENPAAMLVASRGSSVIGSPVASGSNISQTVEISVSPVSTTHVPSGFSATPTADEIVERIKNLPPFEQDRASESYEGLKVARPARFRSVWQLEGETYRVGMTYGSERHGSTVTTRVNISDFPRLKIALQGDRLKVSGTIGKVEASGFLIHLEDAKIDFIS